MMKIDSMIPSSSALKAFSDLSTPKPKTEGAGDDFGKMLTNALEEVNGAQSDAKSLQQDLLSGRKDVDLHDVMISQEKASTAMQLTMAVRNKTLEAFQEIDRLPV